MYFIYQMIKRRKFEKREKKKKRGEENLPDELWEALSF